MRRMAAAVLVFEAFIALFFGLVAAKVAGSGEQLAARGPGPRASRACCWQAACCGSAGRARVGWALQVAFFRRRIPG